MRRQHYLKANRELELPSNLVFVDTETVPLRVSATVEEQVLRLGVATYVRYVTVRGKEYSYRDHLSFTEPSAFWAWLDSKVKAKRKAWVFAHNLAFDFNVLKGFSNLEGLGYHPRLLITDSPPTILRFSNLKGSLQFVDSLNYFQMSLERVGQGFGVKKLPMPDSKAPNTDWATYCAQDVAVLEQAILALRSFVKEHNLGNFQTTAASQAFTAFRHRFMHTAVHIHDRAKPLKLERLCYYGGRVECFRIGSFKQPLWQLDVNGLYPDVMATNVYPTKLIGRYDGGVEGLKSLAWDERCIIAQVMVETDKPYYPYRYKGRLIFPIGRFETVLATSELRLAFDYAHLAEIKEAYLYEAAPLFFDYVDEFTRLRKEYSEGGNAGFVSLCKLMLNSLYGKFGQRGRHWVNRGWEEPIEYPMWTAASPETGKMERWRCIAGHTQVMSTDPESYNSFPAISAEVTSGGRVALLNLVLKAGWDNVFYVDTDSLVVNETGYRALSEELHPSNSGCLKVVWSGDTATFYAPKDYSLGKIVRRKGVRSTAKEVAPNTFEQEKFVGFNGLFQKGEVDHQYVETVTKHLSRLYNKGIVGIDGRVTPLKLNEVMFDPRECEDCGLVTQDYVELPIVESRPIKAGGWVGGMWIPRERKQIMTGTHDKILCGPCYEKLRDGVLA